MGKPMKGRMPGAEALRRAFSPVTPEFAESTHSLLQALPKKRKEEPMKKKLSLALVLALILAALSGAVALALSAWREAGESLVQMEKEYGFYDEWSLENKLRLLSFMQDNQVSLDSELLQTALDPQADASAREAAVDQLIAARYGIDGRVDVVTAVSVLQTELEEEYRFWSLEDKAWFGEIERKYNGLSQDGAIPLTPGEQDLTQEQAAEKARQALEAYRQYDAAAWQALEDAGARLAITYEYAPYDYDTYRHQPTWTLDWYIPDATGAYNDGPAETVMLDQTGETLYVANCGQTHPEAAEYNARYALYLEMEARLGPEYTWSLADKHVYDSRYLLPGENELTEEEAEALARKTLLEQQLIAPEALEKLQAYPVLFFSHVTPEGRETHIYQVYFVAPGTVDNPCNCYVRLDAETGEIEATKYKAMTDEEFADWERRALVRRLTRQEGPQYAWSLENKALLGAPNTLPREDEIAPEEAVERAKRTLMAQDSTIAEAYLSSQTAVVYLREETQADGTVTRRYTVYFVPRDFDVLVEDTFVTMDAKTGETVAWETCPNG